MRFIHYFSRPLSQRRLQLPSKGKSGFSGISTPQVSNILYLCDLKTSRIMLVGTGHQLSPLNAVELYFGLTCPRIPYCTKLNQGVLFTFFLARKLSSVPSVQMIHPAECSFAMVKLSKLTWYKSWCILK